MKSITHKDKHAKQYRLYIRPETIKQVRALSLIANKSDWNEVADDCMAVGVAYFNQFGKFELADWDGTLRLADLSKVSQRMVSGQLLPLEER